MTTTTRQTEGETSRVAFPLPACLAPAASPDERAGFADDALNEHGEAFGGLAGRKG